MRVVCLSDTHTMHDRVTVPEGDLLVHAGDFSSHGTREEALAFLAWVTALPHPHKVVVPGNHDIALEEDPGLREIFLASGLHFLIDQEAMVGGLRVYGSPWTPRFYNWAWNADDEIADHWAKIPNDLDILVTHGPPYGVLDYVDRGHVGCRHLMDRLAVCRPRLHVFGHIHEGAGRQGGPTYSVNAAICTRRYRPTNTPIVVELPTV